MSLKTKEIVRESSQKEDASDAPDLWAPERVQTSFLQPNLQLPEVGNGKYFNFRKLEVESREKSFKKAAAFGKNEVNALTRN